eukprot:Pgem_evm1s3465
MQKISTKIDVTCPDYGDENNFFNEFQLQKTVIDQMIWPELIGCSACKDCNCSILDEVEIPEAAGYFATKYCHGTDALEVKVSDKDITKGVERSYTATDDCGKTTAFTQTIIIA